MKAGKRSTRAILGAAALLTFVGCGSPEEASETALDSARQELASGPDFVVSAVTGPVSVYPGGHIVAQVTVCNQGTDPGYTRVALYLSADKVIKSHQPPQPASDFIVGEEYIDDLWPGQCQTLSIDGTASVITDGAYYLGALVDPANEQPEVSETNNAKVGSRIGVGYRPDFVVSAVTGPTSAYPGGPLTAQVTVCNQGTDSGETRVDLYLSTDKVITPEMPPQPTSDFFVGEGFTDHLYPSQCQTLSIEGPASIQMEGPHYLGALADPNNGWQELIEDNNSKAGGRIGVGYGPDFVVSAVTGPASTYGGNSITAKVTVCNQGTQPGETRVAVLLSSDTTISLPVPPQQPDSFVGEGYTDYLYPTQCQTILVEGPAFIDQEGAYYLGAVADPDNNHLELIEDNNSKAGSRIGIGYRPDFVVSAVSGPASAHEGGSYTAQVTVCNQGTQPGSTRVDVLLSKDTVLTPWSPNLPPHAQDSIVESENSDYLAPGQCQVMSIEGSASVYQEGAYYLGAVVDAENFEQELIEDNNSKLGGRVGVGNSPDFVITSVSGPASALSGNTLTTKVTVCNQGNQPGGTRVDVLLSKDNVIAVPNPDLPDYAQDRFVGSEYTDYLYEGQCQTLSIQGPAWVNEDGVHYLGAVADPQNSEWELIDDNNSKAGNRIGIGSGTDFVITSVSGPVSALPGQSMTTKVTVCNQGTQPGSTRVGVLLSTDNVISAPRPDLPPHHQDRFVGEGYADFLAPGQCQTLSIDSEAWVDEDGAYYLGAVADLQNSEWELIEDNNSKLGSRIGIGMRSDFVITSVSGPASTPGTMELTTKVTVCNQGTQPDSTDVLVLLSKDNSIAAPVDDLPPHSQDRIVGEGVTDYLYPTQCQTLSINGMPWVEEDGAYYLGAVADPQNYREELIEDNNTKAGNRIGVGAGTDFVVSTVTGPTSTRSDHFISIKVAVCNQGTQPGSTRVDVLVSKDTTITLPNPNLPPHTQDQFLNYAYSDYLAPGQCQTLTIEGAPWAEQDGAYYLGAVADPDNEQQELIEDNNSKAGSRIGVGDAPDFVVSAVTGPVSSTRGGSITAKVTVCNQGTQPGSTRVDALLSKDTTITQPNPDLPQRMNDQFVGGGYTETLYPGQCQTLSIEGPAWVEEDGAWYLGALADLENGYEELIEDNNSKAGSRIGIGDAPDYVVSAVTGPSSAPHGSDITVKVTVCNQGTQPGNTRVAVLLSQDKTISAPQPNLPPDMQDVFFGELYTDVLYPNQCLTVSLPGQAWAPTSGAWYLGAVADSGNDELELIDDNNSKAGTLLSLTN